MMRIEVEKAAHVLGLVASDLAVEEARLGTLGAFRSPGGEAAPFVEPVRLEEAAQRGIGRNGSEVRVALGERYEIVVVQPHAPALVGGVLGDNGLAHRAAHRRLPTCVGAQLAAQYAQGIPLLLQRPVIPALDRREAEAGGLIRNRVVPRTLGERRTGDGEPAPPPRGSQ